MSRLYFHSPSGDAEMLGAEYAHLRCFVQDLAVGMLYPNTLMEDIARLKSLIPSGHYLLTYPSPDQKDHAMHWSRGFATAFRTDSGGDPLLKYRGRPLNSFTLALNTALAMGSDPVKLAARITGQGDIHGWVDGPNRAWLAAVMEHGLEDGVYRETLRYQSYLGGEWKESPLGWREVIAFLKSRQDEPVVMSYSVCNGFPDRDITDWADRCPDGVSRSDHEDAWYDLPSSEQWRICMDVLRDTDTGLLELRPDAWDMRFGDGLSVLDLTAQDWEERLRTALRIPDDEPIH